MRGDVLHFHHIIELQEGCSCESWDGKGNNFVESIEAWLLTADADCQSR